eukprot:16443825-Heterocapsa_arctica.AAC.1
MTPQKLDAAKREEKKPWADRSAGIAGSKLQEAYWARRKEDAVNSDSSADNAEEEDESGEGRASAPMAHPEPIYRNRGWTQLL